MTAEDDRGGRAAASAVRSAGEERLFELLRHDHREILQLFDQLAQCKTSEMNTLLSIFNRIEEGLQRHFEGEERFLYTALEQHEETRALVLESYELHRLTTMAIGGFKTVALDDERWRPKIRVLRRLVEEHVELMEKELFQAAVGALDREQLASIAEQFVKVKSGAEARGPGLDAPT